MVGSQASGGRLLERRVLITGAASGIGRRTAQLFASEGAALTLLDRSSEGLVETARDTRGLAVEADVTDETSVANAVEQGAEAMGGIDGIVNAAGIVIYKHSSDWSRSISLLPERKRQFTEPSLHPIRLDVRKVLAVHARCALVGATLGIGMRPPGCPHG